MDNGYYVLENFVNEENLVELEHILEKFHKSWCEKNKEFFERNAINSAYITSGEFLQPSERLCLLKFIASKNVVKEVFNVLGTNACFLNSQLFFDPYNENQANYWHRDIQYSGMDESEQRNIIEASGHDVVHFRLALRDELGVELIPSSHSKWDSLEELDTRLEKAGKKPSDDISTGRCIALKRGDVLVFDANIIHRGHYGKERLSFDLLFCKEDPSILKYANVDCFPNNDELDQIDHAEIFKHIT